MNSKSSPKRTIRQVRQFSQKVKKDTIKDIEQGKCSVLEASRELQTSEQTIYNWIYKYSSYLSKNKVLIVEDKSEVSKTKELEKRLQEVEAALGRKQMELDVLNKMIEIADEDLKTDIKKNFSKKVLNGLDKQKE
jgi:transposase-like protein